ncbi:MAG: sigma-70 family RNA polymerase sigma factor [Ignavibacteriales bacterium]|nr:sigma-70 family RNA polymerase sigma factor [Ignavibacteriales bacterium]
MINITEDNLIQKCSKGDADAFAPLMKIYRQRLFSYLFKLCGNRITAEDQFQETLIKVWRAFPKYDERNKFSSWLFSIAHNSAMDALRKKNLHEFLEYNEESEFETGTDDPHMELINSEAHKIISRAVDQLPIKQREVFLLRVNGEMTFKEIAEATKEPLNTVISHMHYSVKKLRKILRQEYAE